MVHVSGVSGVENTNLDGGFKYFLFQPLFRGNDPI